MLNFIYKIYERRLEMKLRRGSMPKHVMVVMSCDEFSHGKLNLLNFLRWCESFSIREVTVALDKKDVVEDVENLAKNVEGKVRIISDGFEKEIGEGEFVVNMNLGLGGKEEIISAVRELAEEVRKGLLDPEIVDEGEIERRLKIKSEPDVIVRASMKSNDFLIWQSIYSEHVFFDLDWKNLRYIDFLRILREYQKRERRYGK